MFSSFLIEKVLKQGDASSLILFNFALEYAIRNVQETNLGLDIRSDFKILTGNPTGKRPFGKPRRRWEDNIRMDLTEIGISTRNWVDSAQDWDYWSALVNATLNLRVP